MTRLYYTFFSSLFRMNKRKEAGRKGIFSKLTLEKEGLIQKIVKEDVTSTFKTVGNNPETIGTYDFHQHFAFVVDEKDGTITQEHNYLPKNLSGI